MPTQCPRCCAPIPADGPQGLCPKCLLAVGMGEPEIILTASGEPAPPPPEPAEVAPHFPQLEIMKLIGRGGMGAVYEARQKGLNRAVALKILSAPSSADATFEARFVREAQALARLSHENIVAVFDAGRAGPHFYLLMEYVDGPNLRQAIRAGRIDPEKSLALVMQICTALEYAHRQGVVHRDIKPENVLLARDGRVKIADFGLAKVLDRAAGGRTLTRASQAMGTPHYMAPEQIEHPQQVDHRADIYSLGVVFYELLTGELPLGRFPLPSKSVRVDVRLDDIVLRTLEKEPERRYQAASEVRTAVNEVATTPPPAVPPIPPPIAATARSKRPVWPWVVGAAILLLVFVPLAGFAMLFLYMTPASVVAEEAQPVPAALGSAPSARPRALVQPAMPVPPAPPAPPDVEGELRRLAEGSAAGADSARIPSIWSRARELLGSGSRSVPARYLALEERATSCVTVEPFADGELARLRIEAFATERDALSAELWTVVTGGLPMDDAGLLMGTDFERAILPFGDVEYVVSITHSGDTWEIAVNGFDGRVESHTIQGELPGPYRRLLERDRALRGR